MPQGIPDAGSGLAKVDVDGSSPFARSTLILPPAQRRSFELLFPDEFMQGVVVFADKVSVAPDWRSERTPQKGGLIRPP